MKKEQPENTQKELEVRIYSIATSTTESIIFLDEIHGTRILPIWIGAMEAQSIAIRLSGYTSPRPMTHDLFFSMLKQMEVKVAKVKINDIVDNTYYACVELTDQKGKPLFSLDSRPSDAVAIAVRFGCNIYINEKVFEKTQVLSKPITEDEVVKFKEDLKNLKPTDIISQLLNTPKPKPAKEDEEEEEEQDEQA